MRLVGKVIWDLGVIVGWTGAAIWHWPPAGLLPSPFCWAVAAAFVAGAVIDRHRAAAALDEKRLS